MTGFKQFFIEFWDWVLHDMLDFKMLCVKQTEDNDFKAPELRWCSPEYMSYKTEISIYECILFLNGPVNSSRCGLWLYRKQREKMSQTSLTALSESKDKPYQAFIGFYEFKKAARRHTNANNQLGISAMDATQAFKNYSKNMIEIAEVMNEKNRRTHETLLTDDPETLKEILDDKNPIKGDSIS